jgi:flagellar biogenesis protein FliO
LLVKETAGLGERRFVAVLQFERQRFLIGGSPGTVTLLAHLPEEEPMGDRS